MESGMVAMKMSSEPPQQQSQLCFKSLSFNEKRERRNELVQQQSAHETMSSHQLYMECQKNHAAATGGHALDGCGEYMPSPPPSLNCAACGCHRNFHRLETSSSATAALVGMETRTIPAAPLFIHCPQRFSSTSPSNSSSPSPSEAPISSIYPSAPQILMALSSGVEISTQTAATPAMTTTTPGGQTRVYLEEDGSGKRRKRFRTKFSAEQKEKMRRFAEGYGWKMQRSDAEVVRKFCDEIGICRSVLKVWMHNNKSRNTMGCMNYEYNGSGGLMIGLEEEEMHVAGNNGGKQSIVGGSTSSIGVGLD